ncbi:MAG TPA: metal ABC transporter substrate-binding protein [bacterium]|nr:metal ABC transporter substrate-binding protein [bacterium]
MRNSLALTLLVVLMVLPKAGRGGSAVADKIGVAASFYPMYEFARQVGGDRSRVRNLTPAGAEPHDYELTPKDIIAVNTSKVLIYNGAGFEPWAQKLLPQLPPSVLVVNAAEGIRIATATTGEDQGKPDPHIWMDPILAQRQVDNILAAFIKVDPEGKAVYGANAAKFKGELTALHERFQRALSPCRKKIFITNHAAFGYFAARYGLTQLGIVGLAPDAEPSASKIRELIRLARQNDIRFIYYESLVSPRVAAAIAREVGARTLVLDPLEGLTDKEMAHGKNYLSVMDQNLHNLKRGLDCP